MTIWLISLGLNLFLCLLLLYRHHYKRYRVLFVWLIFELFSAPILHAIYTTYGTNSYAYSEAFRVKNLVTILFSFGIIFEGLMWMNRCLRIPFEAYLFTLLVRFVAEKLQFIALSHLIYEVYRYIGIATLIWLAICFRGEERYERRTLQAPRT